MPRIRMADPTIKAMKKEKKKNYETHQTPPYMIGDTLRKRDFEEENAKDRPC